MAAAITKQKSQPPPVAVAVIFGVTGLVGKQLAKRLLSLPHRKVYGIARRPDVHPIADPNFHFIACDLLNPKETHSLLSPLSDATHLFWVTWASDFPFDSGDCADQNKSMLENALTALLPGAAALRHVSLQTGTKHYAAVNRDDTCHTEEDPRSDKTNFYYVLEDLLREKLAARRKVTWTVLRPGLIVGSSNRTFFNFVGSLCVYGAICKKLNLPFVFGGSEECWEKVYIDASDAVLVADHHIWAAEAVSGAVPGEAFNVVNGDRLTWKGIWGVVGKKLGMQSPESVRFSVEFCYQTGMADKGEVWREIVEEEGLVKTEMEDLANWGFMDSLFRCPVKMVASRDKAERYGFTAKYNTMDSILYWIDVMRSDKFIPFP